MFIYCRRRPSLLKVPNKSDDPQAYLITLTSDRNYKWLQVITSDYTYKLV